MGEEVLTYRGELERTSSAELITAAAYRHSASFDFNFLRNVLQNSGGGSGGVAKCTCAEGCRGVAEEKTDSVILSGFIVGSVHGYGWDDNLPECRVERRRILYKRVCRCK